MVVYSLNNLIVLSRQVRIKETSLLKWFMESDWPSSFEMYYLKKFYSWYKKMQNAVLARQAKKNN